MNDRDYWKINHVCQGNRLVAIKLPSAGLKGRKEGREGEGTRDKANEAAHLQKWIYFTHIVW